jgi:acetyl esterase/lipase
LTAILTAEGISVLDTSYRLAPRWPWPAARDDVRAAAAFAKARAGELGLDPLRWAVLGRSAGGQIAESVVVPGGDPTLRALVALYAPADLRFAYQYARPDDLLDSKRLLVQYLGGTPDEKAAAYEAASPIEAVGPHSPPTLLIHGAMDPLTWVEQSRRLKKRMSDRAARAVYLEIPWATHAFDYNGRGPGGQIVAGAVRQFLNAAFRTSAAEGEGP